MSDRHRIVFIIDGGWVRSEVVCPYAADDETRPCWPHELDGQPEAAPQEVCTYESWVDNADEWHGGEVRVAFQVADVDWSAGAPEITLEPTPLVAS